MTLHTKMNYYQKKQLIAVVNKDNHIIKKIEKWEAHRKALLHRGFTVILWYKDCLILQHRKHPVFDEFLDLSFSSHQIYINNVLQTDLEAIYDALKREWNIRKVHLYGEPSFLSTIYYKVKDPNSQFTEHEIDCIFEARLKNIPSPNLNFAYGYSLLKMNELKSKVEGPWSFSITPWVKTMLKEKLIKLKG